MNITIVFLCIVILVLLIAWARLNAFLALLLVSLLAGFLLGIPVGALTQSVQKGMGDTLGSLVVIIALGAMLGKLVAESGAAQQIAGTMMRLFGRRYIRAALMVTGFVIGIPLFYSVGFVLMVPLIFTVSYQFKLPAVYVGLPMLASLSVTHGFLPPHPSPVALVAQFHSNMGRTLVYGMLIAIPAVWVAGLLFSRSLKDIKAIPMQAFVSRQLPENALPGALNSFFSALLPVLLLIVTSLLTSLMVVPRGLQGLLAFISEPSNVMILALLFATASLGLCNGKTMKEVMHIYGESIKDIAMILLVIGGSGAFKQVLVDSGVSQEIAAVLMGWKLHPLVLAWMIAAIIRVSIGSSTVAGLTTAGIIAPMGAQLHMEPSLMVLSIGAGSLMFSHVNDPGFWMFKEYFNLSLKETIRSWSMMETIVSVMGLAGVMIIYYFI